VSRIDEGDVAPCALEGREELVISKAEVPVIEFDGGPSLVDSGTSWAVRFGASAFASEGPPKLAPAAAAATSDSPNWVLMFRGFVT
jgi:hypothetical protein